MGGKKNEWRTALSAMFGQGLSPTYLGLVFILLWNQCVLYAQRVQVDGGITTIEINFARCLCIIVLCCVALRPAFERFSRALGAASIACMTIGSLLFLVQRTVGVDVSLAASLLCGFGLAWGGGMWIDFYERLDAPHAFAYAIVSLLLSAIAGIAICFVPAQLALYLGILLPVASYACYLQAQRVLDTEGAAGPERDDVYASEHRTTWLRIAAGVAVFSFVLGMSRGFPDGSSITLPPLFQVLQYVFLVIGLAVTLAFVFAAGRDPSIVPAWLTLLVLLTVGVLALASMNPAALTFGGTLISTVNLAQVALLWLLSYDIGRHVNVPSCVVLGAFWLLHLVFRESGRLLMLWAGPVLVNAEVLLVALLLVLIACSMGMLLTDKIPRTRPFFQGFDNELARAMNAGKSRSIVNELEANALVREGRTHLASAAAVSDTAPASPTAAPFDDPAYGLTERERQVAALLAEGRTTKIVADELCLSNETVRGYAKNIYAKLGVHSKQELIDLARKRR